MATAAAHVGGIDSSFTPGLGGFGGTGGSGGFPARMAAAERSSDRPAPARPAASGSGLATLSPSW
ncbi:hypothetical protein I547_5646 [Mycobacterium kansasii 824]|nr:hypothetical protein I547_5646 [Mycobacterium kansasii 824]